MQKKSCQVVIQTAFLGDVFLSIPLFQKIKKIFPEDELILVCKKGTGAFFINEKLVDTVFEINKNDRSSYQKVINSLNSYNIENLYCVHRSIRSQLMSFKIRAKCKTGFKSVIGRFIFNHQILYINNWPDAIRQLSLLAPFDPELAQEFARKDWADLNQVLDSGILKPVPAFFATHSIPREVIKKRVALFPGSVWATKKWTEQGFVEVAKAFLQLQYEVYLLGGPDEKELCEKIKYLASEAEVLAGKKTILESVEFIRTCALVISNDSAPAHMAASQNIPVVTIFGPTTLNLGYRPWSSNAIVVENNKLDCRPCGKHGHHKCPLGHHRCMNEIDSKWVIQAGLKLLGQPNP